MLALSGDAMKLDLIGTLTEVGDDDEGWPSIVLECDRVEGRAIEIHLTEQEDQLDAAKLISRAWGQHMYAPVRITVEVLDGEVKS